MPQLNIEVPDDSILASKELTVRPLQSMRLKHLRAFQRVKNAGRDADMDDMALALAGVLIGWSEDEVNELTMDEMLFVLDQLGQIQTAAIPNAIGSSSRQRSARTTRGRSQTGA
jgi:hypothetical protein